MNFIEFMKSLNIIIENIFHIKYEMGDSKIMLYMQIKILYNISKIFIKWIFIWILPIKHTWMEYCKHTFMKLLKRKSNVKHPVEAYEYSWWGCDAPRYSMWTMFLIILPEFSTNFKVVI